MDTKKPKICIIDDDEDIVEVTKTFLKRRGFDVASAQSGEKGLEVVRQEVPDLILLDLMLPGIDGFEVCRRIKEDSQLWHIPIMYFTARGEFADKISGLKSGGDDYITKPFEPEELLARIWTILNRTTNVLNANPLTKLPGNDAIQKQLSLRLERNEKFAIGQIDIDRFKSFNDEYGFERGDRAIQSLSVIMSEVLKEKGTPTDFVGHIGGDDFVIVSEPDRIDILCEEIVRKFDAMVPTLYDEEDRKRGYLVLKDRQGILQEFPLMSLSIAIVTNEKRKLTHIGEWNSIAAELKKYAKSLPGSNIVKDRRDSSTTWRHNKGDVSPVNLREIASAVQTGQLNLFFQPIICLPENENSGYECVLHSMGKASSLSQDELFNAVIELKLDKELSKTFFDKLRVFTYGLQKSKWVLCHLHPKLFLMTLENAGEYFKNFSDLNALVFQIKVNHFLRYEKLLKDILIQTQKNKLRIAISLAWGVPFPLTLLSEARPSFLYLDSSFMDKMNDAEAYGTTLKLMTDMALILKSPLIASGVSTQAQLQQLQELGIRFLTGPVFAGNKDKK